MSFKKEIQKIVYNMADIDPYAATLTQELLISQSRSIPTAALVYDKTKMEFSVKLNPDYISPLTFQEKVAVMFHEIYHFLHGHTFRFMELESEDKNINHTLYNIAADMAINQYIPNLPKNSVNVDDYKLKNGVPMPKFKTMEFYYEILNQTTDSPEKAKQHEERCAKGSGSISEMDQIKNRTCNYDQIKKYKPFDEHCWDDLSELDKYALYKSAKDLVERALEKSFFSHNEIPGAVKGFIELLETRIRKFNFKQILKSAIKQSLSSDDHKYTFKRPSKRYGIYYKGRIQSEIPKVDLYIDCSGSISHDEINQFKNVINELLACYKKKVRVYLFHTTIFKEMEFKNLFPTDIEIESGGTCVTDVIDKINNNSTDISFVLTDGYFSRANNIMGYNPVFWLITKGGDLNHPYKVKNNTFSLVYL